MIQPDKKTIRRFQTTKTEKPERSDHIWYLRDDGRWKCCTCGAIASRPPYFPTPDNWIPECYELPLTPEERVMCPNKNL